MTVNKGSIGTDLTRLDAHVVQPGEYEEIPELTDEMMAKAVFSPGGESALLKSLGDRAEAGRLAVDLDPDLAERLIATGEDWQARVNAILRDWLDRQAA